MLKVVSFSYFYVKMVLLSIMSHVFHWICALCYRLLYVPQALIAGVLGAFFDFPVISIIALCKSPYMLFKGWHRLLHDCIGREGPFLETICVPFAGLAILLWPLAVVGAVLGSIVSSIFLGAYAAVIVYQVRFPLLAKYGRTGMRWKWFFCKIRRRLT